MPARTSAVSDVSSTARSPSSEVRSRATPPKTGMEPPHTPLRPAIGVTGTMASLQAASTAETWAVVEGRTTTAGRWGTAPSAAHPMASGHQSRPASARLTSSVSTTAPLAAIRSIRPWGGVTTAPPRRSVIFFGSASMGVTGVGLLTGGSREVESGGQKLLLAGLDELGGLVGGRLLVPAHVRCDQCRRGMGGRHGGLGPLDHGAGAPGQHVVERLGHLLARRVDELGPH